jgi:hemoglobin/transferrin/lactoferrin receptor protein
MLNSLDVKYSYFVFFVVLFAQGILGQTVTVLESQTREPVVGVTLYNLKKNTSVVTDFEGKASLNNFKEDEIIYFQNFLYEDFQIKKSELSDSDFVVYLNPTVEALKQIVLSASKFQQRKRDIPKTIVSFSAKDIALANPQTSADLLDNTGNIFIQKSQMGGGSPMIRGFSTNRLLITVDGVRMNNAIFRGGNLQNVISIDPLSVQNTEVTLGAGSVVYGSDAIGGVMSFYTKKPQLSYNDELMIDGGAMTRFASANTEKTGHFDINLGYKKWGFLTNVTYTDFDDLRMGSYGPDEYLRPNYVVRGKW